MVSVGELVTTVGVHSGMELENSVQYFSVESIITEISEIPVSLAVVICYTEFKR